MVFPDLQGKYNIWGSNSGIFGLNEVASSAIMIFLIAFVIYIVVISDFHISEVSFGNTKISMLKEKYDEEVTSHINNTNYLLEKIEAEGQIIYHMKEYCMKVKERIGNEGTYVSKEYQILLMEYFNRQKDNIKVSVLKKLDKDELKNEFHFKMGEIDALKHKVEHGEIYSFESNKHYYLVIPFCYIFEELLNNEVNPVYILLESETPISVQAESNIIRNILIKFADDLLELL